ncbi:type I-B CRISPR-associated protein Cas7/Csh2 [Myxococcota bacterium]|nr:type I-B CRISPR-associated protein Cas7/Csh2 [Myxococcota bacterium]
MEKQVLEQRHEILYLYDARMGNPNGDPSENRPRVLPDGTHYVTDVRLKRFVRDFLSGQGQDILVDTREKTTNLTGRVLAYLEKTGKKEANGKELVDILLESFVDARLFGSSLAFKEREKDGAKEKEKVKLEADPKTLTGAVQFNHGEVLHKAEEVDIYGTSVFGSTEEKKQGTFTSYHGLRYALIGFHGVANEHNAKRTRMTQADYDTLLGALWKGVRSAANTRTKMGQMPQLLVSVRYKKAAEFQLGGMLPYVRLVGVDGKAETAWSCAADYRVDLSRLVDRLKYFQSKVDKVFYQVSPDLQWESNPTEGWEALDLEGLKG